MLYFVADEHYYHSNILMFRDDRARRAFHSVDRMHKYIEYQHNEVVTKADITYHLGDFTFSKNWRDIQHLLGKLNGRHILILGNHDLFRPFEYVEMGFESVHTSLEVGDFILIHDPAAAGVFTSRNFIHGHTHKLGKRLAPNSYCVSVELTDYAPVSYDTIKEGFSNDSN